MENRLQRVSIACRLTIMRIIFRCIFGNQNGKNINLYQSTKSETVIAQYNILGFLRLFSFSLESD